MATMPPPSPPRRRWFQLLVLLSILAVILAAWAWTYTSGRMDTGIFWSGLMGVLCVTWVLLRFIRDFRRPAEPEPPPQFNLSALFVLVTLLCIIFGWAAIRLKALREQYRDLFEEPPSLNSHAERP